MKNYSKIIYLHNIKLYFKCDNLLVFSLLCEQLKFPKFMSYSKYIEIKINLSVKNEPLKDCRSDKFSTAGKDAFLDCWIRNILVHLNKKENKIEAQLIYPSVLSPEIILHLIIIEPLRQLLKYSNIFFIHAAVVSKHNTGIIICGPPSAGKSTLVTALYNKGYKFLSDEFAILKKNTVLSLPLKIKLDEESLRWVKVNKRKFSSKQSIPVKANKNEFRPNKIEETCLPKVIIFIHKSRKLLVSPRKFALNPEESFIFLVSDKINSLTYEKNASLRRKQVQALWRIARKTKPYLLSYRLNQLDQACSIITQLL